MLGFAIITAAFVIAYAFYWVFGPINKETDSDADMGINSCAVTAWIVLSILWSAIVIDYNSHVLATALGFIGVLLCVMFALFFACVLIAAVTYLIAWIFFPSLLGK